MKVHAEKTAQESLQTQDNAAPLQLKDNRPEALEHQQVQHMANQSQQVKQFAAMQGMADHATSQITQLRSNQTGLPDSLKSGIEHLSGYSMDDVKVHYNSSKPAQLQAHAYAQGTQIHVAPGQEKHLGHEAWHVVQQKQGRVQATKQLKGSVNINDDAGLEREADVMGEKALQLKENTGDLKQVTHHKNQLINGEAFQRKVIQLATSIVHTPAEIVWEGARGIVGKEMEAKLDPNDPVTGSSTDNGDTKTAIDDKVAIYNRKNYARGHLLNHDLGGYGVPENLFPITTGANAHHAQAIEYPVKRALMLAGVNKNQNRNPNAQGVYYHVTVKGNPSHAQFHCVWRYTDANFNNENGGNEAIIESKLNGPSIKNELDPTFSARGKFDANIMGDWYHGDRDGEMDLEDVVEAGKIRIADPVNQIDQINIGVDVPSNRNLSQEQLAEIQQQSNDAKLALKYKRCRGQFFKEAKTQAQTLLFNADQIENPTNRKIKSKRVGIKSLDEKKVERLQRVLFGLMLKKLESKYSEVKNDLILIGIDTALRLMDLYAEDSGTVANEIIDKFGQKFLIDKVVDDF